MSRPHRADAAFADGADTVLDPPGRYRWVILAIVVFTYMVAGADRANLGIAIPYMKKEFHLSNSDIGIAASIFFVGMTAIQIPASIILQKVGVRPTMVLAMLFTSLSTFCIGLVGNAFQLSSARAVLGIAEGPINIGCLTIINRWFPPHERGTAVGVFVASIKLSPALVPPIGAAIIYAFGWRSIFYLFALPGIVVMLLWLIFAADSPRKSRHTGTAEVTYIEGSAVAVATGRGPARARDWPVLDRLMRTRSVSPLSTNGQVFRSPYIWLCAVGYGLLTGLTYAIMTWVPSYLIDVKHYSLLQTGMLSSAPWIGAVGGSIAGGLISDRVLDERRKPLMLTTATASIVTMYGLMYAPNNPVTLAVLLGVTGVMLTLGYSNFLAYPMGLVVKAQVPLAVAIVSLLGAVGGATSPLVVGIILDNYSWTAAFAFLSACSLCAMVIVFALIEPRSPYEDRSASAELN